MKKSKWFLLFLFISLLISGCSNHDKASNLTWSKGLTKAQKVEVTSVKDKDALRIIRNNQQIEEFVTELELDKWKPDDLPKQAIKSKVFKMYQSSTKRFKEAGKKDTKLNEIGIITSYKNVSYITLSIKGSEFNFKIPKDTANYLAEFK